MGQNIGGLHMLTTAVGAHVVCCGGENGYGARLGKNAIGMGGEVGEGYSAKRARGR